MPDNPNPPSPNGMCLLHGDYHPMDDGCWAYCVGWYFAHPHLTDAEQSDLYALEVERAMLDTHIRTQALTAACFAPTA
jgi:hypothetical protein